MWPVRFRLLFKYYFKQKRLDFNKVIQQFLFQQPLFRNYNRKEEEDKNFSPQYQKVMFTNSLNVKTKNEKKIHPSMSVNVVRKAAATFLWLIIVVISRNFFFFLHFFFIFYSFQTMSCSYSPLVPIHNVGIKQRKKEQSDIGRRVQHRNKERDKR